MAKAKSVSTSHHTSVIVKGIEQLMKESYIEFAAADMYRKLPSDIDGLLLVQRRILYTMSSMKNAELTKAARVVGTCLGTFHPHGDTSVYGSLARMAQDFKLLHPFIVAGGNFGSVEGDKPAAMRYTECTLEEFARDISLNDELSVVDYRDNYDGKTKEPIWLPSKLPLALVNGAAGIATGYASGIPSHNLVELGAVTIQLIKSPNSKPESLVKLMPAPDFATGGIVVVEEKKMLEQYGKTVGKGVGVTSIPKVKFSQGSYGRVKVSLTDIPYNMTTSAMIDNILTVHQSPKYPWEISEIRNLSAKGEVLVEFELKKTFDRKQAKEFVAHLIRSNKIKTQQKYTLQFFGEAVGKPVTHNIRTYIQRWIQIRRHTINKFHKNRIRNAEANLKLLDALQDFINNRDKYLKIMDKNNDTDCKAKLVKTFKLTHAQVDFIMNSKIRSLNKKGAKVQSSIAENKEAIRNSTTILNNVDNFIISDIRKFVKKHGKKRKTKVQII